MQGASRGFIVVLAAAVLVPAPSSAQEPQGLRLPQLPAVTVPELTLPPVRLPAPLPNVSTPPVTVPEVRVEVPQLAPPDAPQAPLPAPAAPAPSAPGPASPPARAPAAAAGPGAVAGPGRSEPALTARQGPAGGVATPAGTPSASPARSGRAARAAALRGGRGLLGTSYRSPRRLVRALSACVAGLPGRQERLLALRYGVGGAPARPDRVVASALGLSPDGYATLRRRALRGVVRDARDGGCNDDAPVTAVTAAQAIAFGDGGEPRAAPVFMGGAGGSLGGEIAVRGERASGGSEPTDAVYSELDTPLALEANEPSASLLGTLLLAAALAVLAVIALRGLRAGVRR
jgi:hypothetical protein